MSTCLFGWKMKHPTILPALSPSNPGGVRWYPAWSGCRKTNVGKVIPLSLRKPKANRKAAHFPLGLQLSTSEVTSPGSSGKRGGGQSKGPSTLEHREVRGTAQAFAVHGNFRWKGFSVWRTRANP